MNAELERLLREKAWEALAKREGWNYDAKQCWNRDGTRWECDWHESFYLDFRAGVLAGFDHCRATIQSLWDLMIATRGYWEACEAPGGAVDAKCNEMESALCKAEYQCGILNLKGGFPKDGE